MNGIWDLKPHYLGPWTLRVLVGLIWDCKCGDTEPEEYEDACGMSGSGSMWKVVQLVDTNTSRTTGRIVKGTTLLFF